MSSTPLLPPVEEPEPERRPTAELGPQSAARASAVASGDVAMLRMRWFWGAAYMCSMGASGMSTIGLSSTLVRLAVRCGTVEGDIADVFLIRGCGALLGAMLSGRVLFAPETSPYAIWCVHSRWRHMGEPSCAAGEGGRGARQRPTRVPRATSRRRMAATFAPRRSHGAVPEIARR